MVNRPCRAPQRPGVTIVHVGDVVDDRGFGTRLAEAMQRRGLSQGQLEKAAGLPDSYVSKLIRGKRPNLGFQTVADIAAALRVRYLWLAFRAFRDLLGIVGHDLRQLAEPWPASQTGAALRLLEVTDTPGVVITPRDVRVRGPEWVWPAPAELRRLLLAERLPEGLERLVINDRRGSGVLLAA